MVVLMAVGEIAKGIVYTDSIKTGYVHVLYLMYLVSPS